MSTEIVRYCDACEKQVDPTVELWTVGVVAVCNATPTNPFSTVFNMYARKRPNNRLLQDHFMDMCRPCMTAKGLIVAPDEEPAKEPDTLDDLLREIVREEVDDAREGEY